MKVTSQPDFSLPLLWNGARDEGGNFLLRQESGMHPSVHECPGSLPGLHYIIMALLLRTWLSLATARSMSLGVKRHTDSSRGRATSVQRIRRTCTWWCDRKESVCHGGLEAGSIPSWQGREHHPTQDWRWWEVRSVYLFWLGFLFIDISQKGWTQLYTCFVFCQE